MILVAALAIPCMAATTIDPTHPYAYGSNIGWINAEADTINGAVITMGDSCGFASGVLSFPMKV